LLCLVIQDTKTLRMSYPVSNPALDQLTNGVQNMEINQQDQVVDPAAPVQSKKKRPARAYHNLNQNSPAPSPASQFQSNGVIPQQQFINGGAALQQPFETPISNQSFQAPATSTPGFQQAFSPAGNFTPSGTPGAMQPMVPQQQQHQSAQLPMNGQNLDAVSSLSVPYQRKAQEDEYSSTPFKSFENTLPPTSTTKYVSIDQGSAVPKFMRLSMYNVPASENLRNATKLPLGLTVRPFAPLEYNEEPVPEVDLTPIGGPPRCRRCRTYINPGMTFTHDQKLICNMCKFPTPLPTEYECPLDASGRRIDLLQRPELHKGTVDFIVPQTYWLEEGVQPSSLHHVFLIDVTAPNEVIRSTTEAIRSTLLKLPPFVQIAIITYDQRVQFYNLKSEQCQVHIASDLEDPFIPIYDGLFVDPQEYAFQINDALNKIDELYYEFKSPEVCYGAALKYALYALGTVGGGKITATLSKLPSWGPGTLTNPNDRDNGTDTYKSDSTYYNKLADEFVDRNVGLDLFVISKSAVDLINSSIIVSKTSGFLKLYPNYQPARDEMMFNEDYKKAVLSNRGYQGQLKVRSSAGLQVSKYYGNFDPKSANDPKLPAVSSEQQYSVLFTYDDKLSTKDDAHFQAALLYTGIDGKRRVRVTNVVAAVSDSVSEVFAFVDQDVVLDIIVKDCLSYLNKQHPTEIKLTTTTKLVEVFSQYRGVAVKSNLMPTELVFPESLKTLIAYISAFQKSKIFKTSISNNLKIYDCYEMNSLSLERLLLKLYPRIIPLHNLGEGDCLYDDVTGYFNLPLNLRASSKSLEYGGAYFIFNGEKLYLWIHNAVNPLLLKDLLDIEKLEQIPPFTNELPQLNTHISLQARNLVEYFKNSMGLDYLTFQIARVGIDGAEFEISEQLVEDRSIDKTQSYDEFLISVHKQIKDTLENDRIVKANEPKHDESTLSQRFVHF